MKKTKVDLDLLPAVKTQMNAHLFPKDHEQGAGVQPSKTVPGMTMTMLEMVRRHRQGLPLDAAKGALYQGEELLPNLF